MRRHAATLHPSTRIAWIDDSLPALSSLAAPARFDLILAAGVWSHLDEAERSAAIARLASLLESAGTLILSIRHGPPPSGRRLFPASAEHAIAHAAACGLGCILEAAAESMQPGNRAAGITWTWLAFQAPSGFLRQ